MKTWISIITVMMMATAVASADQPFVPISPTPTPTLPTPAPKYNGQAVYDTAMAELGIFKNSLGDNLRVRQYVEDTDNSETEYTGDGWCSGFVSWCLKQNGYEWASTPSAAEWSFVTTNVDVPQIGDLVIIAHHIAIFGGIKSTPNGERTVILLGGNQDKQVCIMGVPESLVIHFLEPVKASENWRPKKHIINANFAADMSLDDSGGDRFPNGQP